MIDIKKIVPGCILRHNRANIHKPLVYKNKEDEESPVCIPDPESTFLVLKVEKLRNHPNWANGIFLATVLVDGVIGVCAVTTTRTSQFWIRDC